MTVPERILSMDLGLKNCILHAYRGSIAHGTYEPSDLPGSIDDKDTMAIYVPPIDHFWGIGAFPTAEAGHGPYYQEYGSQGTREIKEGEWDVVIYEVRKAIWLMMVGNPNMLSLLWVPDRYVISATKPGEFLREHRDLFVGRHVYRSFVGYATSQLTKMSHGSTKGYMGEKRKALVEKYGYDTKNASHLIRLLRMGIEFLQDGELHVDRGGFDAAELLAIKHGEWSLEKIQATAGRLFALAEEAHLHSTLPARPDQVAINRLCVDIAQLATYG